MRALTPRIPGGLAVACTLSCALDASISGSSIVTMLAIGSVMVPAMLKAGYSRRFTLGAVMSGSRWAWSSRHQDGVAPTSVMPPSRAAALSKV